MLCCICVNGSTWCPAAVWRALQYMLYCICVNGSTWCTSAVWRAVHDVLHLCERRYLQTSAGKRLHTLPSHPTLGEPQVAVFFSWRTPTNKRHLAKFEKHQSHTLQQEPLLKSSPADHLSRLHYRLMTQSDRGSKLFTVWQIYFETFVAPRVTVGMPPHQHTRCWKRRSKFGERVPVMSTMTSECV